MKRTLTAQELMKELRELEPINVVDYILRGSALSQVIRKYVDKTKK